MSSTGIHVDQVNNPPELILIAGSADMFIKRHNGDRFDLVYKDKVEDYKIIVVIFDSLDKSSPMVRSMEY